MIATIIGLQIFTMIAVIATLIFAKGADKDAKVRIGRVIDQLDRIAADAELRGLHVEGRFDFLDQKLVKAISELPKRRKKKGTAMIDENDSNQVANLRPESQK